MRNYEFKIQKCGERSPPGASTVRRPIVYTSLTSPFGRSVRICLNERGVAHDIVQSTRIERQTPQHLARQPFAKVPVLECDEFVLYETQAILRYVADAFPGESLVPRQPRLAARMNQVIGVIDAYFFTQVSSPIAGARILAKIMGVEPDEDSIKSHLPNADVCLSAIDAILGDQNYMAGEAFSLADLMAGPHLAVLALTPEGQALLARYPRLRRWLDTVEERDSFRSTLPPI